MGRGLWSVGRGLCSVGRGLWGVGRGLWSVGRGLSGVGWGLELQCRLSSSAVGSAVAPREISVARPEIEPAPPALKGGFLAAGPLGKSL